jgi:hypothetical protein
VAERPSSKTRELCERDEGTMSSPEYIDGSQSFAVQELGRG